MDITTEAVAERSTTTAKEVAPQPAPQFPDWNSSFPATRVVLPLEQDRSFLDASPTVVRSLFVDLATVASCHGKRRDPQAPIEVYADVIRLGVPLHFDAGSLTLHARRIEVAAGAALSLSLPPQKQASPGWLEIDTAELAFESEAASLRVDFAGVTTCLTAAEAPGRIRYDYDPEPAWAKSLADDDWKPVESPDRVQLYRVLLDARIREISEQSATEESLYHKRMISRQHKGESRRPLIAEHEASMKALAAEQARCEQLRRDTGTLEEAVFGTWSAVYARYAAMLQAWQTARAAFGAGGTPPSVEPLQLTQEDRLYLQRLRSVEGEAKAVHDAISAMFEDYDQVLESAKRIALRAADARLMGARAIRRSFSRQFSPGDPMQAEFELQTAKCLQYSGGVDASKARQLSVSMARWVNDCHAQTQGDARLAAESALLLERVLGVDRSLRYVPQLQFKEYFELAEVTAVALLAVERHADCFFDRDAGITDRKAAASEMLAHYANAKGLSEHLLQQAQEDVDSAQGAHEASVDKLKLQSDEMDVLRKNFDDGVQKKKQELETQAILGIVLGVATIAIGIAQACMGNPAAAAGAGDAVKKGAEAADKVGKMAALIAKVTKAMEIVKKLLVKLIDVEKVLKLMGGAYKGYTMVNDFAKTQALTRKVNELGFEEQVKPEDMMTAADWDAFIVEMRALFKQPIDAEIEGAVEYLSGLEKLAVRSKDVIDTALHLSRCQQVCVQRNWGQTRDERDMDIARQQIGQLDARIGPDFTMRLFCERLGHQLKFQLMDAIGNAGDAFRYFALREPDFKPSIHDTGAKLQVLVARAKSAELVARESFRPPPASWGPQTCRVWAHDVLAEFRTGRSMSWTISTHCFRGYERIRIQEIRVWLVPPAAIQQDVHVEIRTSGIYRDRWKGETFEFGTEPLQRTFTYRAAHSSDTHDHRGHPVLIKAYADDVEDAYFQPTPFTTWEISVPEALNPHLDLSAITEVGLEFFGTYIGATSRARPHALTLKAADPTRAALRETAGVPSLELTVL